MEYVSTVPGPPLDGLIDDLYFLQGTPPYSRLMLPAAPAPAPLLIVNLGAPFHMRAGTTDEEAEYVDGCGEAVKAIVGVTPKRLARSYRFTFAVLAIDVDAPIDWADVAARAGYFDQAHFGREFREFTGLTPTRYVEARRRFRREHPGHTLDGWPVPAE